LKQEKYIYSVLVKTPAYGYELTVDDCVSFGKRDEFSSKWLCDSILPSKSLSISTKIAALLKAYSIGSIMESLSKLNSLFIERQRMIREFLGIILILSLYIIFLELKKIWCFVGLYEHGCTVFISD
jgi:hypothetical protein